MKVKLPNEKWNPSSPKHYDDVRLFLKEREEKLKKQKDTTK